MWLDGVKTHARALRHARAETRLLVLRGGEVGSRWWPFSGWLTQFDPDVTGR
jgi:hypothetical protein